MHFISSFMAYSRCKAALRTTTMAALSVCAMTAAHAVPYAIYYTGQAVAESGTGDTMPGATGGEYQITLVFDNGNASTEEQEWQAGDLQCVIWKMRRQGSTVFEQNMRVEPATHHSGSIKTGSNGALTEVFTTLSQQATPLPANAYTLVSPPVPSVPDLDTSLTPYWFIPNVPGTNGLLGYSGVFYLYSTGFDDASGQVSTGTNLTGWSTTPTRFRSTSCAGQPLLAVAPQYTAAKPVPTLGEWALIGLSSLLALMGLRRVRCRRV
ncbi:IPTL-CTERM sorting domain-containing protein [Lampropedia puyangensis]|uniref:IPTL-CTERM sorting domain-containing protein n=1 Tax=Lampropedia puyangensis TaxID=1330072 RepID=A0A4S8EVI9_9BURK|nr:IPTL-CTERM sorting domain-containing protein [Lampropedia puyangensis]THT96411.1 IPTL-CTERM sorting domain-containing protein [Lampropedia puyangensis]